MKKLAIIPARAGSKGFKHKNIKELNGKPLIAYTIEAAIRSNVFDEVMVSTDSESYAGIAKSYGAKVPFLRSAENSNDTAASWEVVKEVLNKYNENNIIFDSIALLQPTSPLRDHNDILDCYKMFLEKSANLVTSVNEVSHSPLWSNTLPGDLSMNNFIKPELSKTIRQKLQTYYTINGAIYFIKTNHLFSNENLYSDKSYAFIMDKQKSVDIDEELDFLFAEFLLNRINTES